MATSPFSLKALLPLIFLSLLGGTSTAQTGQWSSHTSFQEVLSVAIGNDRVWAGTSGGVFAVDNATGEIDRFTIVDGLHAVSSQTLAYDSTRNVVWLGYVDGVLDRIDPDSGQITSFRDIARADQFASRGINRIRVAGDSLVVSTDFGVVIFDPVLEEVRDSYTRLGSLPPSTKVNDIIIESTSGEVRIWAATDEGLAVANADAPNLQDPVSWSVEIVNGLPVLSVAAFSSAVYAGTSEGLFRRDSVDAFSFIDLGQREINQLAAVGEVLYGVERFRVVGVFPGGIRSYTTPVFQNPTSLAVADGRLVVGDRAAGLVDASAPPLAAGEVTVNAVIVPQGPSNGVFTDLSIASDGDLLVGGSSAVTSGFFQFTVDGDWTSYTGQTVPALSGTSRYTRVHEDASGNIWAASEGSGVARISPDGSAQLYNEDNSSLEDVTGFDGFIIAGGVTTDRDNNLWVTTRGSIVPLHIRTPDGQWQSRGPLIGQGLASNSTAYDRIYNDAFNQKWIIVRDPTAFNVPLGVVVLDDVGTPLDSADDEFRYFNQRGSAGQGLPSNRVTSVAEDKNGLMWVGTEEGPAYFVNTGFIARDQLATAIWPQLADRSDAVFLYFGLPINDIAVDPANRIWFATNEGVRIVRELEGGYEEIQHLTTENAPLPSDVIVSIAIREATGEVFIATEGGMVSTQSDAVVAAPSPDDLRVYPNPFDLGQSQGGQVTIDGLVDETLLRITSIDGSVVRTFQTRGGRIQWDGRNEDGDTVPSGMYLIVAVSERGEGTAFGKVAVIN